MGCAAKAAALVMRSEPTTAEKTVGFMVPISTVENALSDIMGGGVVLFRGFLAMFLRQSGAALAAKCYGSSRGFFAPL
jgi:hypothetical protein